MKGCNDLPISELEAGEDTVDSTGSHELLSLLGCEAVVEVLSQLLVAELAVCSVGDQEGDLLNRKGGPLGRHVVVV